MPLRAVLFDFDGVLADTENVHVAAWQRTFGELGWEVPDEVCVRSAAIDDRLFLAELFADRQIFDGDVEGWVRRKQSLTVTLLTDYPRLYPGVVDLVQSLQGRVRLAVVTGTWRENVEAVLGASGLVSAFELIVAKEDVAAPKPDPAPYRLAVERLQIEPREAVALEDSPDGLASARAAGVRVVAIGHRRPQGDWSGEAPFHATLASPAGLIDRLGLAEPGPG